MRIIALLLLLLLVGCFRPTPLILLPDSPMLIERVSGDAALVSAYDKESNSMLSYGWITVAPGWTLARFDWEAYIARQQGEQE